MKKEEPRIVFAAIVAFTDKQTRDRRILATPKGFMCPARDLPLPVLWMPPNHKGKAAASRPVGRIEQAYVIDKRLIIFGCLDQTEDGVHIASRFSEGSRQLEIDVISGHAVYDLDPATDPLFADPAGPITFTDWKLTCAWVGSSPCWDLPPVQIEELYL